MRNHSRLAEYQAASLIPGRRLSITPDNEANFKDFQQWIRESFEIDKPYDWNGCNLPRRVLDVGDGEELENLQLKETESSTQGRYIALSHCWGKSLPIKTTTKNLLEHSQNIRMSDLTQTFRDAVFLTRQFNIRYLWIDSLCILQDSRTDWETESAKMGDYYGSSWLTIAAGMSTDGLKGCFAER